VVTHVKEGLVSWSQPRLPFQDIRVPALPNFWVLPYLCLDPLTQNDQIRHSNTYGEGRVLGQPRHCVCTNASRGLSATAEFLVSSNSSSSSSSGGGGDDDGGGVVVVSGDY